MATTLLTELTNAGCPVSTATIVVQQGIGRAPEIGRQNVDITNYGGAVVTSTNALLSARMAIRQDSQLPRCMAFDGTNNFIYIWHAPPSHRPKFVQIPTTSAQVTTGNIIIPILGDT